MNIKNNSTRQHILDIGYQLVVNKGFTAVGLSELLKSAEVPKGSFYHYFQSKEQFGQSLIEEYFRSYMHRMQTLFSSADKNGYEKLISYFSRWLIVENGVCNANRCLVVKLSAEVSDLSDPMRNALADGAQRIMVALSNVIAEGIEDSSIKACDPNSMAELLYQQWLGASLLNKLVQDQRHLEASLALSKQWLNNINNN